jgi:protein-disulfide isomerase
MINENTIVITQERMCGWLMFNRFHKVDEKLDLKDANRKIYIFKDSPQLRDTMARYNQYKELIV